MEAHGGFVGCERHMILPVLGCGLDGVGVDQRWATIVVTGVVCNWWRCKKKVKKKVVQGKR